MCTERGSRLTALETFAQERTYAWRQETDDVPFDRVQLFDDDQVAAGAVARGVWSALTRVQPDVVAITSYGQTDALAALAWCRAHGKAAVMMNDSKADDAPRVGWRERAKSVLVRRFDAALVAGAPQRRYFTSLGIPADRMFEGYAVVDHTFFADQSDAARALPRPPDLPAKPFFLASNRFLKRKNLAALLRSYALYRRQAAEPWALVLLGDGPERERLEQVARDIADVQFAGFRQVEELPTFYGHAGAFVHPALSDQWGLVVNEAAAARLPLVVSTAAGCHEDLILPDTNGISFDPNDEQALADALLRVSQLSASERPEWGGASRRIMESRFTPRHFGENLMSAARAATAYAERRGLLDRAFGYALFAALHLGDTRRLHTLKEL